MDDRATSDQRRRSEWAESVLDYVRGVLKRTADQRNETQNQELDFTFSSCGPDDFVTFAFRLTPDRRRETRPIAWHLYASDVSKAADIVLATFYASLLDAGD